MASFSAQRRVEFRDTDAAGIVHFSVFFTYMEAVEHELLRSLGLTVLERDAEGAVTWPRVAARCDYHSAVRFEDVLNIEVHVSRLGRKSITYAFTFACDQRQIATGEITAVCCRLGAGGALQSILIPPALAEKLKTYAL
jgi:4-hydroxybenzoyl-CoA thioesterase/acyl-CoA thioester hydrolase